MALVLTLTQIDAGAVTNRAVKYALNVSNTGASSANLTDLRVSAPLMPQAVISQPNFKTPNVAAGTDNPIIGAASSADYVFSVVWPSPATPGPSPNTPGLGPTGMTTGQPPLANYQLSVTGQLSDGSTASTTLTVPVLSAVAMFPVPQGGAALFTQGANANLTAAIL